MTEGSDSSVAHGACPMVAGQLPGAEEELQGSHMVRVEKASMAMGFEAHLHLVHMYVILLPQE